jgi:Thioredoxin-like domain
MVLSGIFFQAGVRILALCSPHTETSVIATMAEFYPAQGIQQVLVHSLGSCTCSEIAKGFWGARPKLIVATMPQCVYCDRLKAETLASPEVAQLLEQFDVQVVDKSENPELLKGYSIAIYPSIVVLSSEGNPLGKISGFVPREHLARTLRGVLKSGT